MNYQKESNAYLVMEKGKIYENKKKIRKISDASDISKSYDFIW